MVDHFLLLQGLADAGMTEDDIDFRGVLTDAAAAGFAAGEFDAVGVFAPFTLQALEREGSNVLFDSSDFPGTISDHLVVDPRAHRRVPGRRPGTREHLVRHLDFIEANPDEATAIMAELAELTPRGVRRVRRRHHALHAPRRRSRPSATRRTPPRSSTWPSQINPFLVEAGLIPEEADITGLFDPSFTQAYVDGQ